MLQVATDIARLGNDIGRLPTRNDVSRMIDAGLSPVHAELKSIRTDLKSLKEKVENVTGYRKEIDHAFERIAAIEKHLGLKHEIKA